MSTDKVIDQLNEHMGISDAVRFDTGESGLTRAVLTNGGAEAHVYQHAAHLTHFKPAGEEPVIFVSSASKFQTGKAIRGGVPICFPWFGDNVPNPPGKGPAHGFARDRDWKFRSMEQLDDGAVKAVLVLKWSPATLELWPHKFVATQTILLRPDALTMEFRVKHLGLPDDGPFSYEVALHTYFNVGDVRKVKVTGLENTDYIDKVDGFKKKNQGNNPVTFAGETDSVYLNTPATCVIHDPVAQRRIIVEKTNSLATVVWNPWTEKAGKMSDMGKDQWPTFVCIESANVAEHATKLSSEEEHTMTATIRVQR